MKMINKKEIPGKTSLLMIFRISNYIFIISNINILSRGECYDIKRKAKQDSGGVKGT